MIGLFSRQAAEVFARREHEQMIPVVKSITVTGAAATAIQGDYITLRYDGRRIRYRIILQVPDETDEGSVTLYLTLDRIIHAGDPE